MNRTAALLAAALVLALPAARADDEEEAPASLRASGKLKPIKGEEGAFELKYRARSESGRRVKREARVQVSDATALYVDRLVPPEAVAEGATVWVLGKLREREDQTQDGTRVVTRQITEVVAIATGPGVAPLVEKPLPRDPDLAWRECVRGPGASFDVTYDGGEWKVVFGRGVPLLLRIAVEEDDRPKALKKGASLAAVRAERDGDAYRASELVLCDKRLARVYPLLEPEGAHDEEDDAED